jgi:hypothetical protein
VWGPLIRTWLDQCLPPNAHALCSGRVTIAVRQVSQTHSFRTPDLFHSSSLIPLPPQLPLLQPVLLSHFPSRQHLIDACMASAHGQLVRPGCGVCILTWRVQFRFCWTVAARRRLETRGNCSSIKHATRHTSLVTHQLHRRLVRRGQQVLLYYLRFFTANQIYKSPKPQPIQSKTMVPIIIGHVTLIAQDAAGCHAAACRVFQRVQRPCAAAGTFPCSFCSCSCTLLLTAPPLPPPPLPSLSSVYADSLGL